MSGGLKVSYTDKQKRLEGRRREQETDVFRERYAKRSGLESTNSGIKRRLGLGQLRVRGRRAVAHALYLKVAGWNLLRAAASGQLRGLVARALARLGAARVFWLVFAVWSLVYRENSWPKRLGTSMPSQPIWLLDSCSFVLSGASNRNRNKLKVQPSPCLQGTPCYPSSERDRNSNSWSRRRCECHNLLL